MQKLPIVNASYQDYLCSPVTDSIFVEHVTIDELYILIDSLDCSKSCGADCISPQLIKENKQYFCEPFVYLYNQSLMQGIVPDKLKIANVIPIFKKAILPQPQIIGQFLCLVYLINYWRRWCVNVCIVF